MKNISFIMDRTGKWILSPAYDITFSYNPTNKWLRAHQMTVNNENESNLKVIQSVVGHDEEIGCVVLELGYFVDFENKGIEDPLSVALSITEIEKKDERISISIKEMLEEYVW